ncbi:unnamed protein product [Phytomonas sp. Hart1]|nr:unnamed protein product [Phytomonas sp. Hart1]|eukprot:CCW68492.1 unnamed protein product [Phytomonas sp. isolate Hart1]
MEGHFKESTVEVRPKRVRTMSRTELGKDSLIASTSCAAPLSEIKRGEHGGGSGLADVEDSVCSKVEPSESPSMHSFAEVYDHTAQRITDQNQFPERILQHPASNVCFAFDLMRLSFSDLRAGSVASRLPIFVRLLEEYESWGVGTTQRLREDG